MLRCIGYRDVRPSSAVRGAAVRRTPGNFAFRGISVAGSKLQGGSIPCGFRWATMRSTVILHD